MEHIVQQGDYLAKIAKQHGIADWRTIWDHPSNAALKSARQNPNVLYPGDVLVIPGKQTKEVGCPTDQRHRFTVKLPDLRLVVVLERPYDAPLGYVNCDYSVEGDAYEAKTDAKGKVERQIPPAAQEARITLKDSQTPLDHFPIPLRIGRLDPVDTISGQCGRLNNLAYMAGPYADCDAAENARLFESAVQEFQCDHGLTVDGLCGPRTQAKLKAVHGC